MKNVDSESTCVVQWFYRQAGDWTTQVSLSSLYWRQFLSTWNLQDFNTYYVLVLIQFPKLDPVIPTSLWNSVFLSLLHQVELVTCSPWTVLDSQEERVTMRSAVLFPEWSHLSAVSDHSVLQNCSGGKKSQTLYFTVEAICIIFEVSKIILYYIGTILIDRILTNL